MTLLQLKKGVDRASKQDRRVLAAYLSHLSNRDDPDYRREMEASVSRATKGETFTLSKVKQLHRNLVKMGR